MHECITYLTNFNLVLKVIPKCFRSIYFLTDYNQATNVALYLCQGQKCIA